MAELAAQSALQYVKGVGPVRAARFAELGLHTVGDLLLHFPFRYEEELGERPIEDLTPGVTATIRGEVMRVSGRYQSFTADVIDSTGECRLRWFRRRRGGHGLYVGAQVIATGKTQEYNHRLEMVQPRVRVFPPDAELPPPESTGRKVPVYRSTQQTPSHVIRAAVESVLRQPKLPIEEFLPTDLLRRHKLPARAQAVRHMHAPPDEQRRAAARRRMAYEEFLILELAMALRRRRITSVRTARKLHHTPEIDRRIRARFPFELTAAQNRAIDAIVRDVASGHPMTRLLQGDVGSGKTVVALYACLVAVANKRQAAIMAPTEILARQHYKNIQQYLSGSRVRAALLCGGLRSGERSSLLEGIEAGCIDLVVGTQALIQQDVAFKSLSLIVVDEQHRFGVVQRATIRTKGPLPHYLVMTATPIPRTLAMTAFGDLDVATIDASPPNRGRVTTTVVPARRFDAAMRKLRPRLEQGAQAYVVCPLIGETPEAAADVDAAPKKTAGNTTAPAARELRSVTAVFERLAEGPWRGLPLAKLHGGMKATEKQQVLEEFAADKLAAIVATTVVEVGVDVPGATLMIVEHAERFGLAQLHQLRGRIGRGRRDGECLLVTHSRARKAVERLNVLTQTTNGFRIAEEDLRIRGPGEFLGTRQHGLPELKVGDLGTDFDLLEMARRDAFDLVERDPDLRAPEHQGLHPALRRMFGERLKLILAG